MPQNFVCGSGAGPPIICDEPSSAPKQEGGPLVAVVQCVRIVERLRRQPGVEVEVRRAGNVRDAIGFAEFQPGLQIVRTALLRDLCR